MKKIIRAFCLGVLLILAMVGIGITGVVFLQKKNEQDYDNEIKTEVVEGKQESLSENQKQ